MLILAVEILLGHAQRNDFDEQNWSGMTRLADYLPEVES